LFVNASNHDYHLQSIAGHWNGNEWTNDSVTSPCIDAGYPQSDYSNEPQCNGNRINIGAYGNTICESKSPAYNPIVPIFPSANFSNNVTSGYAPLYVQFTDQSGNATNWSWNFGDGATSTQQNPVHIFTTAGTCTVSLTASNLNGTDSASAQIIVSARPVLPVAAFTASSTTGNVPLRVTFTDKSRGSPTSWSWDFGDGGTSTQKNPVHVFTTTGTYTVSLTASNLNGTDSASAQIVVSAKPLVLPVASFSASPTTGYAQLKVAFTDKSRGHQLFGDGILEIAPIQQSRTRHIHTVKQEDIL
jgi:PKD repeat protein